MKKLYLLFLAMAVGSMSLFAQKPIPQTNWTLVEVDSEEVSGEDGAATNAFDGDPGTFWHTDWATTSDPYPHHITIDLGTSYDMIGFQLTPRSGNTYGVPDTFSFWTSTDNVAWDSVAGGAWNSPYDVVRTEAFTSTGQYIKLVGHSGQGDYLHMVVAELNVLISGADFEADVTSIEEGESVNFTDLSGNNPVAWEWVFEGGTPATSTEQNPTVTYNSFGVYDVKLISIPDAGDPSLNDTTIYEDYILVDVPPISREDWAILYADSESGSDPAANMLDGDLSTIWHTSWDEGAPDYPHLAIIDMGANYEVTGFTYVPRSGGGNGTLDEYAIYITKDTAKAEWGTPAASGAWEAPFDVDRNVFFDAPVIGRFIIFQPLSEKGDNIWASCAELYAKGSLYGAAFSANKTEIYATQSIDFKDLSSGTPSALAWDFEGGTPATSTESNPVVTYNTAGEYDVKLVMTPQSGATDNDTLTKEDYIVVKDIPYYKSLSKEGWKIISFDSEEPEGEGEGNGLASCCIDDDESTFWHTQWSGAEPDYPHYVIIDLGANTEIVGFEYLPREGGGNGTVAQYEFNTSIDAETYTLADSGTWTENWAETRTILLDAPVTGRFVKFDAKSEKAGNPWTSCREINVLVNITGVEFISSATFTEKGGTIDFVDFSAGDPTSWAWEFEGGTPATSAERHPTGIQYDELGTYAVTLTTSGGSQDGTMTKTEYINVNYTVPSIGSGVYVTAVKIGKVIAHYSEQDGGYVDYTETPHTLVRGETYSIDVDHIVPWDGYDSRQGVWIDWNNDGVLDAEGEMILDDTVASHFTVPADAVLGNTRMRVVARLWDGIADPYEDIGYGEMEDYTIEIVDLAAGVPVADFETDVTAVCEGYMVAFTDLSTNTPTDWSWTFEGGTPATSDLKNPVVYYETAGVYDVSLTASQTSGSDDETKADLITVNAAPTVSAGADIDACYGDEITLTGSGAATYEWNNDVVDGVAFVPASMSYVVIGTDASGCTNTDTVEVTVAAQIDLTVTPSEETLLADAVGATYQWIDCADNSDIAGATNALFEPEVTGDYAVVATVGACSTTSDCIHVDVVGIDQQGLSNVNIYPNPSNGMVNIDLEKAGASIKIYNMLGSLVYSNEYASVTQKIELNQQGVYLIQIRLDDNQFSGKLVVE